MVEIATKDKKVQSPGIISKLMAPMPITEAKRAWSMHFIQVKANIKQPKKTHKVHVHTKKGRDYDYKYADLKDVDQAVMDACRKVTDSDNNVQFGYYFDVNNGAEGVSVQTILIDASGYSKATNKVWFKNFNVGDAQTTASLISYAKRYSLSAAFGIASEDDDDAQNFVQQGGSQRDIDIVGLKIIWRAYINDHDEAAKAWITKPHDPDTASEIKSLLDQYKKAAKSTKSEDTAKKEALKKIKQTDDETIKKLVDGKDPHEDKKTDSKLTNSQTDLFNDILGN